MAGSSLRPRCLAPLRGKATAARPLGRVGAPVRARSVTEVSRDMGVSREVVAKLAAGLSARAGGVALVRAALSTLTEAFTPTAA